MTDATAGLIGAGFSTIVNTIAGVSQQKKQNELQEKIARMNLAQQAELEARMREATTAMERQKLLFEALAVDKHREFMKETNRERNMGLIVIGFGMIALATVVYLARRKQNG